MYSVHVLLMRRAGRLHSTLPCMIQFVITVQSAMTST